MHHVFIISRNGTAGLTSCFSLSRTDAVSQRQSCAMHRNKPTDSSFFSTYRLNSAIFKTQMKDRVPLTQPCRLKWWIFLNRQLNPSHRSLDNCFFNWENHSFTAQCQTKRIKSTQWSGRSLWSEPRLEENTPQRKESRGGCYTFKY